ncbi:type II toxin-antitoxin system YoeB family toxin [Maricaulis sp.]|uniref:type II toxin-antitoxin system YoeB family toxin n=1 Tax=Maricaulis sp. TaxID=1486257 RepID=UPI003A92696E
MSHLLNCANRHSPASRTPPKSGRATQTSSGTPRGDFGVASAPIPRPGGRKPGELAGWWSRRIDSRHRLVYRVTGEPERLQVVQARYHY